MELPIQSAATNAGRALRLLTRNPMLLSQLMTSHNATSRQVLPVCPLGTLQHLGTFPNQALTVDNESAEPKITLHYSGVDAQKQRIGITFTLSLENDKSKRWDRLK